MTSHLISYMARRAEGIERQSGKASPASPAPSSPASARTIAFIGQPELQGKAVQGCTFCDILAGSLPAHKVYEDEHTLAFLDILPVREGHVLVIPKKHYARISHMPQDSAAALGSVLPKISRALCRALDQPDFNVVSNQGYAQIVDHVHFHLVPAPLLSQLSYTGPRSGWASTFSRDELDDDEGREIAARIRTEVEKEEEEKRRHDTQAKAKI